MNLDLTVSFLGKEKNQVSLPDPNHDNKNTRFQLIGGSGSASASIGSYTFDPFFVAKAECVPAELVRYTDFASDLLVLRLFSAKVVKAVLEMETNDVGNKCVSAMALVFARMRLYTVNSRSADWKTRSILHTRRVE